MKLVFLKIFQLWNHVDFIWKLFGYEKKLMMHLKTFNDLTDKVSITFCHFNVFINIILIHTFYIVSQQIPIFQGDKGKNGSIGSKKKT